MRFLYIHEKILNMALKKFEEYKGLADSLFGDSEDAPMNMEVEEDEFAEKFYDLYHTMRAKLGIDKAKELLDKLKSRI